MRIDLQFHNVKTKNLDDKHDLIFVTFCLWSFVLITRPQDYITSIKAFHPGMVFSIIMLIVFFFNYGKINHYPLFKIKQVKFFSWLLVVMVLSIPTSIHRRVSFDMVFFTYSISVLYFFIFVKVINTANKLRTLIFFCCLGIGIYSLVAISNFSSGRLQYGTIFDPNDICLVVLAFLPLNFLFIGKRNPFLIRLLCFSIMSGGVLLILLSSSRGGLVALLFAAFMLLKKTKTVKTSKKFLLIIPCLIIFSLAPINYDRFSTMFNLEDDYNVTSETGRIQLWTFGVDQMIKNPLTGVGVENFARAIGLDRQARGERTLKWQPPHNSLIQIGAETGCIGLILFITLCVNVIRIFNKTLNDTNEKELIDLVTFGLVGCIGMFISAFFLSFAYSIYFVFYFAFSAVVSKIINENSDH